MITIDAMFPVMTATDLTALKEFYETTFGFHSVFFDASFYLHLVLPETGIQLGFLQPNHPSQPDFLHTKMVQEGYVISFEVADIQSVLKQAKDMELTISMPLKIEDWGQTHFMVQDPAGFNIDLVQHVHQ